MNSASITQATITKSTEIPLPDSRASSASGGHDTLDVNGCNIRDMDISAGEITKTHQVVLNNAARIDDLRNLAVVMSRVFHKPLPELLFEPVIKSEVPEEHCNALVQMVKQLDIFFQQSPVNREGQGNQVERWEAAQQKDAIGKLSNEQKKELVTAIQKLELHKTRPLQLSKEDTLVLPGAAIIRLEKRADFSVQQNPGNTRPKNILAMGSSRVLSDNAVDRLTNTESSARFEALVKSHTNSFKELLGDGQAKEIHAQMAMMDIFRENHPDSFLKDQPIYVVYTGDISFKAQSLNTDGQYEFGEETTGRPNTEASMVNALRAIDQLQPGSNTTNIKLVSNQPFSGFQELAGQRVSAQDQYNGRDTTIQACGEGISLETSEGYDDQKIFAALDSARKAAQLFNPNYQVITNWSDGLEPDYHLFVSESVGEWQIKTFEPAAPQAQGILI